ncbi:MAG: vitamin K epoxide reductase family protein [Parcubacteria group bacterium]|nr:vitamin K epoxide reductase family protein [Parcubacteria group bacterium]
MKTGNVIRGSIIVASLLGMLTMIYLVYLHYAPVPEGGSFCDIGEAFSCDLVNKSAYSEFLGIPMAAFGVVYFGVIVVLSIFYYTPGALSFIALFLIVLLGPSLYLSVISKTVLKSMCILCESSKTLMVLITILALYAAGVRNVGVQKIIIAIAAALAFAGVVYFVHSLTITDPLIIPESPFRFLINN